MILCSLCYYAIQKYYFFVTTCADLQEKLLGYISNFKKDDEILDLADFQNSIRNLEEDEKVASLNQELHIKCETDDQR